MIVIADIAEWLKYNGMIEGAAMCSRGEATRGENVSRRR